MVELGGQYEVVFAAQPLDSVRKKNGGGGGEEEEVQQPNLNKPDLT
jgi:hypothetical protein